MSQTGQSEGAKPVSNKGSNRSVKGVQSVKGSKRGLLAFPHRPVTSLVGYDVIISSPTGSGVNSGLIAVASNHTHMFEQENVGPIHRDPFPRFEVAKATLETPRGVGMRPPFHPKLLKNIVKAVARNSCDRHGATCSPPCSVPPRKAVAWPPQVGPPWRSGPDWRPSFPSTRPACGPGVPALASLLWLMPSFIVDVVVVCSCCRCCVQPMMLIVVVVVFNHC